MAAPVYGTLVPLVGRINTAVLAVGQVRWFIWSAFYQQLVEHGYADVYDPTEPGIVVALRVDGQAATYAALPTTGVVAGAVYVVQENGKAYVWSGTAWPAIGAGISITGPSGGPGVGVSAIATVGTSLRFDLTDSSQLFVSVPALVDAKTWRDEAAVYAADMHDTVMPQIAADRVSVESARTDAIAARGEAVAAAGTATGAATTATGARDATLEYRDTAAGHAEVAGTARDQAVAAQGAAETASGESTSARNTAVNTLAAINQALVDYDADFTGYVTAAEAAQAAAEAAAADAQAGAVPDNGVSTIKVQDGAVTAPKLATDAVTTGKIAAGAVTRAKLDAALGSALTISVKEYGAVGNGTADDTAAIQSCIDASPEGSTILFPPGTYKVSATVKLKGRRVYRGAGIGTAGGSAILLAASTNLAGPILAAEVYTSAKTTCDEPLRVQDLCVDGNKANQSTGTVHGVLLINYWSTISNVYVRNCTGAAIKLTDKRSDGNNVTNSCSENRVLDCKLADCTNGIVQESNNGESNQDGFADGNMISDVSGTAMKFARAAGWSIRRNHLYGVGLIGIEADQSYATVIAHNYIEDFGAINTSGNWVSGISVIQLNDWTSVVEGNFVNSKSRPLNSRMDGLNLVAGSNQTTARIAAIGNTLVGTTESNQHGIYSEVRGTGVLTLTDLGNRIDSVDSARVRTTNSGVTIASNGYGMPADFVWIATAGTRKTGLGDKATGMPVRRPFIIDEVTYQFDTADASGSTTVSVQKNGTNLVGAQLAVTAANQADGSGTDAARTATLTDSSRAFAVGDRLALNTSALGTTPGKGLSVYVKARWL